MNAKAKRRGWIAVLVLALAAAALIGYFANIIMEKRAYRLEHPDSIILSADEFGVDRYLVAAVIHCESGNRQDAVSPSGAVGLMQIMPPTGEWIANKLELGDYSEGRLVEPELNIRMGCWYLAYLSDKYGGDRAHVLAAYNAGPGNVDKWLQDPAYAENGVLRAIPFAETEQYVDRVQRAYEKYRELYENQLG